MVTIRPFRATDQAAARALIEEGLGEHFGCIDRNANPDLVDIAASYSGGAGAFFVAEVDGKVVGTTGLIVAGQVGRLVRVAVARDHRRAGMASALLKHITDFAARAGVAELIAYTQPEWPMRLLSIARTDSRRMAATRSTSTFAEALNRTQLDDVRAR